MVQNRIYSSTSPNSEHYAPPQQSPAPQAGPALHKTAWGIAYSAADANMKAAMDEAMVKAQGMMK